MRYAVMTTMGLLTAAAAAMLGLAFTTDYSPRIAEFGNPGVCMFVGFGSLGIMSAIQAATTRVVAAIESHPAAFAATLESRLGVRSDHPSSTAKTKEG